jgi:hypothetical protein
MRRTALFAILLGMLVAAPPDARAHTRDQVFSSWTVDGGRIGASLRLTSRLAARHESPSGTGADLYQELAGHFLSTLMVYLDGAECGASKPPLTRLTPQGTVIVELAWHCGGTDDQAPKGALVLQINSLFNGLPNHVHFARFRLPDGKMDERIFTNGERQHMIELGAGTPPDAHNWLSVAVDYAGLGIIHILAGADHLAFILALMLIAPGLRALVFIVTGFTLGHSLTLAFAATGAVTPVSAAIEALIGFTVAIVAVEAAGRASGRGIPVAAAALPLAMLAALAAIFGSALPAFTWAGLLLFTVSYALLTRRADNVRWAVAIAVTFGLVHGFGFAGVLQEIGLPENRLIPALLGFNLGVEAGQLMVVAVALTLAAAVRRFMPAGARPWAVQALAASLCGLGVFWFVSRAFAG